MRISFLAAAALALAALLAPARAGEGPLVERWAFSGSTLDELRASADYPDNPASRWHAETVDLHDLGDHYALRVRGAVVPAASGEYVFWLCSDDDGEFWLSPDSSPAGAEKKAWLNGWASRGDYGVAASQKSAPVRLEAGRRYYFEALMREGSGGDHLQLSWSRDGGAREVVPASCLEMFDNGDREAPSVPQVEVARLSAAVTRFSWAASADATGVRGYRVYRDGALVREQMDRAFAVAADDGAAYCVSAVDILGNESARCAAFSAATPETPRHGLLASYYRGRDFAVPAMLRTDACVNFNWGGGAPSADTGANDFCVRWEGTVTPRHSETYTFTVTSDDGARLWIDGKPVIDQWVDQSSRAWSGAVDLEAGRAHGIRLEYYENGGDALCRLAWKSRSQPEEIVPEDRLAPAPMAGLSCEGGRFCWTGQGLDNLWSNPANWSRGQVPGPDCDAVFSGAYPHDCFIDGDVRVHSLVTADGYANSLLAAGRTLRVSGDLCLSGTSGGLDSACVLALDGAAAQEVSFGSNQKFAQVRVENRAARVTFRTDVRAGEFSAAPGATLAFDPGRTLYADSLSLRGAENAPVRLGPAAAGDGWKVRLLPGGRQEIAFVEVAGSDAGASDPLDATAGGRDYGGNRNWVFATGGAVALTADEASGVLTLDGALNGVEAGALKVYVNGVQVPVVAQGERRWGAAAELAEGENVVKVLDGEEVILEKNVAYAAGDVTGSALTVRAGDGLFLGGEGNLGPKASVRLDLDGDGSPETPAFAGGKFALPLEPGAHEFVAAIDRDRDGRAEGENEVNQRLVVRAVAVDWRGDARGHAACQRGFARAKNDVEVRGAGLRDVVFTASNPVACVVTATGGAESPATATAPALASPALTILPLTSECPVLQARWGSERGPVIAECPLDVFDFGTNATSKIKIMETLPDGSAVVEGGMMMRPRVPGLLVRVNIFVWGATFLDGTVDLCRNTDEFAEDASFKEGEAWSFFQIVMTRERQAVHGPCHTFQITQNGTQVGSF